MHLTDILAAEWKPALGCTEPAAVAWASALARSRSQGAVQQVRLVCDPRTYKNCYAVGLPNSGHKTGILWALALGTCLRDTSLGLESFSGVTAEGLTEAQALLDAHLVTVDVDPRETQLRIDVTVTGSQGTGRAVLEREHTCLARLEENGRLVGGEATAPAAGGASKDRDGLAQARIADLMALARQVSEADRARLQEGVAMNLAVARHGVGLLPQALRPTAGQDAQTRLARLVSGGVFARMSGEPHPVMTLAGSGNKGITVAVPVALWGREAGHAEARIEEALAFACLMTAAATRHLGTLSAVCGAANAAGIGIASALVMLEGGDATAVGRAVNNMVGNVAGMVCDGAKIGCAMKTMTGVDSAFRAAHLALAGIGIPDTDGIVGHDGEASLANLGRLAQKGMADVDMEILAIMQEKLHRA